MRSIKGLLIWAVHILALNKDEMDQGIINEILMVPKIELLDGTQDVMRLLRETEVSKGTRTLRMYKE